MIGGSQQRWDVSVLVDGANRCLHVLHGPTVLDSPAHVVAYCQRIDTLVTAQIAATGMSDVIVRYDQVHLARDANHAFMQLRSEAGMRRGGTTVRYATTPVGRSVLQLTMPAGEILPNTYELAIQKLLLARSGGSSSGRFSRRPSFDSIRARINREQNERTWETFSGNAVVGTRR